MSPHVDYKQQIIGKIVKDELPIVSMCRACVIEWVADVGSVFMATNLVILPTAPEMCESHPSDPENPDTAPDFNWLIAYNLEKLAESLKKVFDPAALKQWPDTSTSERCIETRQDGSLCGRPDWSDRHLNKPGIKFPGSGGDVTHPYRSPREVVKKTS